MDIASHNMQQANANFGNLWHWPTEYETRISIHPNLVFTPQLMKWGTYADNGYSAAYAGQQPSWMCRFTENSVSGSRSGGYAASVFLDLSAGKYTLSFQADMSGEMRFIDYKNVQDGNVVWSKAGTVMKFNEGQNSLEFEVKDGIQLLWHFYGGKTSSPQWVTLTKVKIQEGVYLN